VLIGNAAAALQGAPVTTGDFDFLFRKTPRNVAKLKQVARALGSVILRPYYPVSDSYRVVRDDDGLQVDFVSTIHGIRSFAGIRDRATRLDLAGAPLLVASLDDIIKSKRAARRPAAPGRNRYPGGCSWRPRGQAEKIASPHSREKARGSIATGSSAGSDCPWNAG
jgi:hypothetical protein